MSTALAALLVFGALLGGPPIAWACGRWVECTELADQARSRTPDGSVNADGTDPQRPSARWSGVESPAIVTAVEDCSAPAHLNLLGAVTSRRRRAQQDTRPGGCRLPSPHGGIHRPPLSPIPTNPGGRSE